MDKLPYINVYYEKKNWGGKNIAGAPLAPGLWGNADLGMRLIAQMEQMVFQPYGINPIQKKPLL